MKRTDNESADDVNALAEATGLQYRVHLSRELSEILKPNAFLSDIGIQFCDRINTILSILKANFTQESLDSKESIPRNGIIISIPIVKGPYVREEMISIKAELTDDNGNAEILLTAILETE